MMTLGANRVVSKRDGQRQKLMEKMFPEVRAGGFSRLDGTVEFYLRVNALLSEEMTVLDYGAGRAEWLASDQATMRRDLRNLRGKVREVIGVDIDPVVQSNLAIDRAIVLSPGERLPLLDASVDLVVSDFTFEHVADPRALGFEFARVVKPGGWVCARTPNKWGYIAASASLVPNRLHARILSYVQPGRQELDVFPTLYRLNSGKALKATFPVALWDSIVYSLSTEPVYFGNSTVTWRAMRTINKHVPSALNATMLIFLCRRQG